MDISVQITNRCFSIRSAHKLNERNSDETIYNVENIFKLLTRMKETNISFKGL